MADLFNADLSTSVPSTMTSVNTSGNTLDHSGPNRPNDSLHLRNNAADGWDILGVYTNSDQGVAVQENLVIEVEYVQDLIYSSDSRQYFAINTTSGLDYNGTNTFGVYRNTTEGIGARIRGADGTPPDDQVLYLYPADDQIIMRIRIQADGSAKAYYAPIESPTEEVFLGSSKLGSSLQTFYTSGSIFVQINNYKAWAGVGGGSEWNNLRIYVDSDSTSKMKGNRMIKMGL